MSSNRGRIRGEIFRLKRAVEIIRANPDIESEAIAERLGISVVCARSMKSKAKNAIEDETSGWREGT